MNYYYQEDVGNYTKDKYGVYYGDIKIEGADPESFRLLGHYSLQEGIDKPLIPSLHYGADAMNAYYKGAILPDAGPRTLQVIPTGPYYHEYAKDVASVFYENKKIIGADPNSFLSLKISHTRDVV